MPPFFSVIIATRNRPTLFGRALESVLAQSSSDTEIVVVNDGSSTDHKTEYDAVLGAPTANHVRSYDLISRPDGHGGSYARNFGAAKASAPYLCFLDDDDSWLDHNHLNRARMIITHSSTPVDLYMTDQVAFLNDEQRAGPIWIEDLPAILDRLGNQPNHHGAHLIDVGELLQSQGFCHLNTLIIRRKLYEDIGGMEETIRWEEDRDLYLRLIDRASVMKYVPITVARHNIPDPTTTASMTTVLSDLERRIFQLAVFNRALHLTRHPAIHVYARRHKGYTLKRIAESLAAAGRYADAAHYARDAFRISPTIKWAGYITWLTLRAILFRTKIHPLA
jgi:glycosyltransferase involved in cell wall biosynthesis